MSLKKRHLLFGGAAAVVVVVVIVVAAVLTVNKDDERDQAALASDHPVTFDEALNGTFKADRLMATWWDDSKLQMKDDEGNIVTWDVATNDTTVLVDKDIASQVSDTAQFVSFAPDTSKNYYLFKDNVESVYRHSFLANYVVLDGDDGEQYPVEAAQGEKLQYAKWRPKSAQIVFVYKNDVYIKRDVLKTDVEPLTSGSTATVYNGVPDWVYEEEVLADNNAIYFSGSGKSMAFGVFDDTGVDIFQYTKYGDDPIVNQYPTEIHLRYPKAGTTNPKVTLKVVKDLDSPNTIMDVAPPQEIVDDAMGYIYSWTTWATDDVLSVIWLNRIQNVSVISKCVEGSGGGGYECRTVHRQEEEGGWIDIFQNLLYSNDGEKLLQIQGSKSPSQERTFQQIALVDGNGETFITSGNFTAAKLLGWREDRDTVYFIGTAPGEPGTRHLYEVQNASGDDRSTACVTCGSACAYSSVEMSPDLSYYVQHCKGPSVPRAEIRKSSDHSLLHTPVDNEELRRKIEGRSLPETTFLKVPVNGYDVPVVLHLPSNLDENAVHRYPLLIDVYGGPGSQNLDRSWGNGGWRDFLTTNYGVVYGAIDGRGTGFQSNEYMFELYRRAGTVEMEDQIAVTRSLLESYRFVDPNRTAIWGWSYGGYATLMTMVQDTGNVFKCGMAVAPPTDWRFYDTIYTERTMSTPDDNPEGYENGSLIDKVEALRGKTFMINHGVADDNVHYQQSMMLVRQLELADIQFVQNSYPDENHALRSVSRYLYHGLDTFLAKCFGHTSVIP